MVTYIFNSFVIFLIGRSIWVFQVREKVNEQIADYRNAFLNNPTKSDNIKIREYYNLPTYYQMMDSVYSFLKMIMYFWVWDIEKMIENREVYDMITKKEQK